MERNEQKRGGAGPLFLGVDGGGTKTDFLLAGTDGAPVRRFRAGGSNVSTLGPERTADLFCALLAEHGAGLPPLSGAFLGLAGSMADGKGERLAAILRERLPGVPIEVGPDIRCVIEAAEADGGCVAAILGTGSCVYADDGRALHRYGGWGWLVGDPCSGYALGREEHPRFRFIRSILASGTTGKGCGDGPTAPRAATSAKRATGEATADARAQKHQQDL